MKNKLFLLASLLSAALSASAGEYWIRPDGTDNTGSGTAADPWVRATSASFESLVNGATIPNNSTIHLMAGTFLCQEGITMKPGWKIVGAGMDVTVLQLEVATADRPGPVVGGNAAGNYYYWRVKSSLLISLAQ